MDGSLPRVEETNTMKGHLFEENIEELTELTERVYNLRLIYKKKGNTVIASLLKSIADDYNERLAGLEIDINNYENWIEEDIDKTKNEILQRLRRL